jgi:hypothetical protein
MVSQQIIELNSFELFLDVLTGAYAVVECPDVNLVPDIKEIPTDDEIINLHLITSRYHPFEELQQILVMRLAVILESEMDVTTKCDFSH